MSTIRYEFDTREEAIKLLDKYNFKKHIPYRHTYRSNFTYYIEIEDNKISYCSICFYGGGLLYKQIPFYDEARENDFMDREEGEALYNRKREYI